MIERRIFVNPPLYLYGCSLIFCFDHICHYNGIVVFVVVRVIWKYHDVMGLYQLSESHKSLRLV